MRSTRSDSLQTLFARRLSRRRILGGACEAAALSLAAPHAWAADATGSLGFARVAPSQRDDVVVPQGYRSHTVVRWGDPLFARAAALDPARVAAGALLSATAADEQARQFGYNCDGMGVFERGRTTLVCVNHETPSAQLLFPGWAEAARARALGAFVKEHPAVVAYMQAAVGLSVVELERKSAGWGYRVGSRYNRRVTATTPIELAGPAREHPLLNPRREATPIVLGTFNNCAAGTTPWGTYLTAEENVDDWFGNGEGSGGTTGGLAAGGSGVGAGGSAPPAIDPALAAAHRRFGFRMRESLYRWEYADPRFDSARNPAESLKFGWIVEIDPFDPSRRPKKRTALGRVKHESATTVLADDGRAAVYMGDDQQFEYLYKFVTARKFDPERPDANRDLLDEGTLHVARFADDGSGEWLPLVFGAHPELSPARGFASQADVVLRCREAADRLGATPLDRPEDIAVNPRTHKVYVSMTSNTARGSGNPSSGGRDLDTSSNAVSPRSPNPAGQIVELTEDRGDAAATSFRWEIFILAGAPVPAGLLTALPAAGAGALPADVTYFGGVAEAADLSGFANPDNLGFDAAGNLWIVTDGVQPGANNNGCFACPTEGPERGRVRQFMSGPVGAEICGCKMTADGRTLFLTLQHPGAAGTATAPVSHWPDGGAAAPRPSLIAIVAEDGRPVGA
jgi:secreted PhoX family phosphatase